MLPPDQYRKWTYPPPGRQWLQFGDKQLNQAIDSISKEAHDAMTARREGMRQVHVDYLERNNYFPVAAPQRTLPPSPPPLLPPPPPPPVERFSIADPEDGYQSAEEGPSRTSRMIEGAKHITKNYAWPFTRDILAPAAGEVAVEVTKGAAWLIGKSIWSLADIIWALNGGGGSEPPDEEGERYPPIGSGGSSSSGGGSSNRGQPAGIGNGSSSTDEDVDELAKKGKGFLVEEIYKKPGWANLFGREDANGYTNDDVTMFRKKLGKMSPRDLAKVLVSLNR